MRAMPTLFLAACVVLAGIATFGIQAEELEKTPAQLIEQLRSDDFDQRQTAALKLEKQAETARSALEAAAKDDDAEVRTLVSKLLAKLSKATLRIHVFDSDNKPLSNSEGTIVVGDTSSQDEAWQQHETPLKLDADGKADLKIQTIGLVRIQLKFPGFLAEDGSWSAVEAHGGLNHVVITLDKGGSLHGTLANAAGKPVKDSSIMLFTGVRFDPETFQMQLLCSMQMLNGVPFLNNNNVIAAEVGTGRVAQAGEDGKWRLENVAEGVYTCVAQAPGHYPALGAMVRVREGVATAVPGIVLKERHAGKIELKLKKADGNARTKETVSVFVTPVYSGALKERMQAAARNVAVHSDQKETDENGAVEIDDLSPGKYQVAVTAETDDKGENGGTLIQTEIEIKPGETVRLEQLEPIKKEPAKNGSIKGRIMTANAKGAKGLQVRVATEENWASLMATPQNQPNQIPSNLVTEVATDSKGFYRFENLAPGKYAVEFHPEWEEGTGGPRGYVFGIEVALGQQTLAPEVTLKAEVVETLTEIKGRVLLPGGEPVLNAEVQYICPFRQNTTTSTQDNGAFTCRVQRVKVPAAGDAPVDAALKEYIFFRHAGCKPCVAEAPFDADKDYKLQAQDYGSLRITVTDDQGKPLSGVALSPVNESRSPFYVQKNPHNAVTNAKGVARLNGLATGPREFLATLKGYFLPLHAGRVEVVADEEKDIKWVMRPGLRIDASVRLPEGFSPSVTMATLDDWRFEPVGANGTFSFSGVTPGDHYLSVKAPGLMAKLPVAFKLSYDLEKIDATKPRNVVIELVQPGGIAIDCGVEFAGCAAQLVHAATLNATQAYPAPYGQIAGAVDSDGRAEFRNLPPGQYQLSVFENSLTTGTASPGELTATPSAELFEVKPVVTVAALTALEAVKSNLKRGTATASGRVRITSFPLGTDTEKTATISLKVQGRHAVAEGSLQETIDVYTHSAEPLIVGKPPENFKPHVPGTFEIKSLPAGEYSVFATLNLTDDDEAEFAPPKEPIRTLIGSFTIKDGEKLNVGELKFDALDLRAAGKPQKDILKMYLLPEDRAQEFEP